MATNKRMFSSDIVGSDAFLEMPSTSQSLYFHLGMRCDDDGFVNPMTTMRMTGANKNDLDILITKRFLLQFKNGVVVIKHHRINNNWDSRDCRRTLYTEQLSLLFLKDNKAYTLDEEQGVAVTKKYVVNKELLLPDGIPTGLRRQNRIEENRIEENKHTQDNKLSFGELQNVKLKSEEHEKLLTKLGEQSVKELIFELDMYIASKGIKYKSHYATILTWAKMKHDKKQSK